MYLVIVAVFLFTTLFFTSGHHLGTTGTIEEKENPMKNTLLDKGIITPSGEISKDKISLVAGAITQPFAEMVWVTTGGDMETINRLTDVLVSMNTPADRGKLFKIIKMLYGLIRMTPPIKPPTMKLSATTPTVPERSKPRGISHTNIRRMPKGMPQHSHT